MKPIIAHSLALVLLVLSLNPGEATAAESVWLENVDQAIAAAKSKDSLIVVDLYAEWCGWCKVLESDVFSSPEFKAWTRNHVLLRVDTVDQGEGSALQALYGVRKLPTVLVLNADRVKVGMLTGVFPAAEYVEKLQAEVAKYDTIVTFYDKIHESDKTEFQHEVARDLHSRLDGRRAAGLYEKVLQRTETGTKDAAWLLYYMADAYRIDGASVAAREYLKNARDLARMLDESELLEQSGLLGYYVARGYGDCEGAQSVLRDFLRDHPESDSTADVRGFLDEYRQGRVEGCAPVEGTR